MDGLGNSWGGVGVALCEGLGGFWEALGGPWWGLGSPWKPWGALGGIGLGGARLGKARSPSSLYLLVKVTPQIWFWAKFKTPKTHNSVYQNQTIGVDSASLSKTSRVNQLYFHHKMVSAYHPWVSVISDPTGM